MSGYVGTYIRIRLSWLWWRLNRNIILRYPSWYAFICIMHFIRYASWSRDAEDEPSRPQARATPYGDTDGQTKQVSEQKMVAKWSASNNTNLVLPRQAPVHLPPPCCFKIFITLYDVLGDRSCVLNNWCISFLENWLPFLDILLWKWFYDA
jgi:hypothetical protein